MAGNPTKRRLRRAAKRLERQRRAAVSGNPARSRRGHGWPEPPPPYGFDDPEGGAGVREPRRPFPGKPADSLELRPAEFDQLNLTALPLR